MVMAIVTFIVVVIGATFAYFTAKASSENEAVASASHFVQIDYNDGKDLQANDLIPATEEVALFSYHGMKYNADGKVVYTDNQQCIDDNSRTVCSIYSFDVTNLGSVEQNLGAFVTIASNQFTNLNYVLYNVTDVDADDSVLDKYNNKVVVSKGTFSTTYNEFGTFTNSTIDYVIGGKNQLEQVIGAGSTSKYELVIWLNETGDVQNEQMYKFSGKMTVSLTDENHVAGYIEKAQ
jgi:predicted ribosomally synthesized peptide with SipW-like signal peptide